MVYFKENTHFDPRNIDTFHLQDDMEFYDSMYRWYSHQALIEDDKTAKNKAIMAHTISETLKAVLCLCVEPSNQNLYNDILDKLCPIKRTETLTKYEFVI